LQGERGRSPSDFLLDREQVRRLTDQLLSLSPSKETVVLLRRTYATHLRAAFNAITTSGSTYMTSLTVGLVLGNRLGVATTEDLSEAALQRVVREAEERARSEWFGTPLGEERPPLPGPQEYLPIHAFFESTARATPEARADAMRRVLEVARAKNLVAAAFMTTSAGIVAVANSAGLFAYHASTDSQISITLRTKEGNGSGWASTSARNFEELEVENAARIAAEKAIRSVNPRELPPGEYTVILEPDAFADMGPNVTLLLTGRRGSGAGIFGPDPSLLPAERVDVGQLLTPSLYTLRSDPTHPKLLGMPFVLAGGGLGFGGGGGMGGMGAVGTALLQAGRPTRKVTWIEKGVVRTSILSAAQARRSGGEPTPPPVSLIVEGGEGTLEDLIRKTDRALLVTRFWYIRPLNPILGTSTGLTRDGLFLVEKGEITYPIKNFRFNESWRTVVENTEAMTAPYKRVRDALYPAVRTRAFTFSSSSEAIE
jgi:predicted Zn-dependent protease